MGCFTLLAKLLPTLEKYSPNLFVIFLASYSRTSFIFRQSIRQDLSFFDLQISLMIPHSFLVLCLNNLHLSS